MLILAIDTSGETCSVAVSDNETCRAEYAFRHERHLIERLPGAVQFVLADAGLTINDIEAFAVGLGPGSFTGVRVGVTFAKVWAMATGKPVVGVSSLDALAYPHRFNNLCRVVIAPTRKVESVVGFYLPYALGSEAPPEVISHDQLHTRATQAFVGQFVYPLLLIGEHAWAVVMSLDELVRNEFDVLSEHSRASNVAALGFNRLQNGESDDTDALVPLYVTPPPTG